MKAVWQKLDAEQLRETPPSTCRYCGGPIYWEMLRSGKKQPVNAIGFERHYCNQRGAEKNRPGLKKEGAPGRE